MVDPQALEVVHDAGVQRLLVPHHQVLRVLHDGQREADQPRRHQHLLVRPASLRLQLHFATRKPLLLGTAG